jgi:hypothetical protein
VARLRERVSDGKIGFFLRVVLRDIWEKGIVQNIGVCLTLSNNRST